MLDLNQAESQRPDGVIPDGTYARVLMTLRGGGYLDPNLPAGDQGLLRASKSSSAVMLDVEFVVLTGPHKGRKFWKLFTVIGGKTNEKGESTAGAISRRSLRGIVESALNIRADDQTTEGNARRVLPGFHAFHGMEFAAKIGIEEGTDGYADKNDLAHAVTPDEPEYVAIMNGQVIEAKPTTRRASRSSSAPAKAAVPAWQQQAQPAAAQPWQTAVVPASNGHAPTAQPQPAQPATAPAGAAGGPAWLNS